MNIVLRTKIKYWFDYLRLAHKSSDPSVISALEKSKEKYQSWGAYQTMGFDEWWKKFLILVSEDLIKSFDFLQDSKLEIPPELPNSLNDYLKDSENEVYLATGRSSDGKPAFLVIVKSIKGELNIKCDRFFEPTKFPESRHDNRKLCYKVSTFQMVFQSKTQISSKWHRLRNCLRNLVKS
jgi:hypothetical protein